MGLFLQAAVILNCGEDAARAAIKSLAGKNGDFELVEKECRMCERNRGVNILFNESANGYEQLAEALSLETGHPVLLMYIYDEDYWGYFLYENGRQIDCFNPMPDYFVPVSEAEKAACVGHSEVISDYFGVTGAMVEGYLKPWTESMLKEPDKKAYEEDEFGQCDCWQLADFMKKIGFPYEW